MLIHNVNDAVVVNALLHGVADGQNPALFGIQRLTEASFSVKHVVNTTTAGIVDKIDLGELFKNIPQSIVGLSFDHEVEGTPLKLQAYVSEHKPARYPTLDNGLPDTSEDDHVTMFIKWKRLVGINDLSAQEVLLGYADGTLTIVANNSVKYTGKVVVKVA